VEQDRGHGDRRKQRQPDRTLKTDNSGNFQLWLNRGFNPLQLIAARDGYQPVAKVTRLIKGSVATVNFALNKS
jgi:hypothetical protein